MTSVAEGYQKGTTMLDTTQTKQTNPPQFIRNIQDTDATLQVPAMPRSRIAAAGENDWMNSAPPNNKTLLQDYDPITDSAAHRITTSAWEELKKLASKLLPPEQKQSDTQAEIEVVSPVSKNVIEPMDATQYIPAVKREPTSEAILPKMTIYKSPIDAPWDMLGNACSAFSREHNRRDPACLRISGKLAWKLSRDIELLTGSPLRDMHFKFFSLSRMEVLEIPIIIDESLGTGEYGATQTVICIG